MVNQNINGVGRDRDSGREAQHFDAVGDEEIVLKSLDSFLTHNPQGNRKRNFIQTYQRNTPLYLIGVTVRSSSTTTPLTVTLALSDAAAGTLHSSTLSNAAVSFINGTLMVQGSAAEVNAILDTVQFTPTTDYAQTVEIQTTITAGQATPTEGSTLTLKADSETFPIAAQPFLGFGAILFNTTSTSEFHPDNFADLPLTTPGSRISTSNLINLSRSPTPEFVVANQQSNLLDRPWYKARASERTLSFDLPEFGQSSHPVGWPMTEISIPRRPGQLIKTVEIGTGDTNLQLVATTPIEHTRNRETSGEIGAFYFLDVSSDVSRDRPPLAPTKNTPNTASEPSQENVPNAVPSNTAPDLRIINKLTGATQYQSKTITYADILEASDAFDADGDELRFRIEGIGDGVLTLNGEAVTVGQTLVQPGDTLQWISNQAGATVLGLQVRAIDELGAASERVDTLLEVIPASPTKPPNAQPEFWIAHYTADLQGRTNSSAVNHSRSAAVTALKNGGFVVAWASENKTDTGYYDIYVQRYDSEGIRVGNTSLVNLEQTDDQVLPTVTQLPDGGFMVLWSSHLQDGDWYGIYGRRFSPDGVPGAEFRVNTTTTNNQNHQRAILLSDDTVMITWDSWNQDGSKGGIIGRRFDSTTGQFLSNEFIINTTTNLSQRESTITATSNGGFIVTWASSTNDSSHDFVEVFAQRFAGFDEQQQPQPIGPEFQVNTSEPYREARPQITTLDNGNFVVTWWSLDTETFSLTRESNIFAQIYSAEGQTIGNEFQIGANPSVIQFQPVVIALAGGNFLIAWSSHASDASEQGIRAQCFDHQGQPIGDEFAISEPGFDERWPEMTRLADGNVMVTWQGRKPIRNAVEVFGKLLTFNSNSVPHQTTYYHSSTPYTNSTDSPFQTENLLLFHLEDFQDDLINGPALTIQNNTSAGIMAHAGVVADDPILSKGRALQINTHDLNLTFDTNQLTPTHVGLVITDIDPGSTVTIEAFDRQGRSLGMSDTQVLSNMADDFLGISHTQGITSVQIATNDSSWVVDHIQYGYS